MFKYEIIYKKYIINKIVDELLLDTLFVGADTYSTNH